MTTTHLPATFTFAPTVNLTVTPARPDYRLAHAVDRVQSAFNSHMFALVNYDLLRPVSDKLYDLFCALETGAAGLTEIAALRDQMRLHPLAADSGMMTAIAKLSAIVDLNTRPVNDDDEYQTVDGVYGGGYEAEIIY